MNLLNIPTFTNKDLEWIDKQPWFYVEVKRFVMTKTGAGNVNSMVAKYGTYSPTCTILYPVRPDKERGYGDSENPVNEKRFIERAHKIGFQQLSQSPTDLGGSCISTDESVVIRKTILFMIDNLVSENMCIIGYCKQFDCNIGLIPEGKWMEDNKVYILPKTVTEPTYENIMSGQFVGSESHHDVSCMAVSKFPFKTVNYVYNKLDV